MLRLACAAATAFASAGAAPSCRAGSGSGSCAAASESLLLQTGASRQPQLSSGEQVLTDAVAVAKEGEGNVVVTDSDVTAASARVEITTFMWNSHWQCSTAARGAKSSCKDAAIKRFVDLVKENGASIAVSVELSHGMSQPVHLFDHGLWGWSQVDGPCQNNGRADSAAVMFAPGWKVLNKYGGCLRHDDDTRAFAVALVQPPIAVQNCPELCVIGVHAPHADMGHDITDGLDKVRSVCGDVAKQCTLAMGDWNAPADKVQALWSRLVGGGNPTVDDPNDRTCCFPESEHKGVFDHLVSNVPGAQSAGHSVLQYQILAENPVEEHKPVVAKISLPSGR